MSGGHCTHPTGGPAIRLKHKKKPRVVDFFFFLFDYTIELFWLFQNTSFVLSRKRKNQIVVTIGTLLHHIHVEF